MRIDLGEVRGAEMLLLPISFLVANQCHTEASNRITSSLCYAEGTVHLLTQGATRIENWLGRGEGLQLKKTQNHLPQ